MIIGRVNITTTDRERKIKFEFEEANGETPMDKNNFRVR